VPSQQTGEILFTSCQIPVNMPYTGTKDVLAVFVRSCLPDAAA